MGDSLRKLLIEENDSDPLILIKFMVHIIKAIIRFREVSDVGPDSSRKSSKANESIAVQLEPYLQKAENEIRQHIRVYKMIIASVLTGNFADRATAKDTYRNFADKVRRS